MNHSIPIDIERAIRDNWLDKHPKGDVWNLSQRFRREGIVIIREIVPDNLREAVRAEVLRLLDKYAERRDLRLATTGNTPRKMSVVRSELIAQSSELIVSLYQSKTLQEILTAIGGEPLIPCPSEDEEFLITRHEQQGDTHGWHWGDYAYALIWVLETPAIEYGGMLQCVPHTKWDKSNPRINDYLCENPIATYGFVSGDVYFLRTDTTLHRTVPLSRDATRFILNITWASAQEATKALVGNDRWWEDANAAAVTREAGRPADG